MRITDPKIGWLVAQRKSWHSCELNPTWVIVGELGKSWPGVLSWDPQYLCKRRKRVRRVITAVCQYSAVVWSWRNHSWWTKTGLCCKPAQIHTALACAGSTTAHKDTDILALDFIAERVLLRLNVVAAVNISESVCSFTARCHSCMCLPFQGSHCWAPFTTEGVFLHQSCTGDLFCPPLLSAADTLSGSTGCELCRNACHAKVTKKSWQTGLLAEGRKQYSVSSWRVQGFSGVFGLYCELWGSGVGLHWAKCGPVKPPPTSF